METVEKWATSPVTVTTAKSIQPNPPENNGHPATR